MPKSGYFLPDCDMTRHALPDKPRHIGFLLLPDFPLMSYASAVEPLRAANASRGRALYRWSHLSVDGAPGARLGGL